MECAHSPCTLTLLALLPAPRTFPGCANHIGARRKVKQFDWGCRVTGLCIYGGAPCSTPRGHLEKQGFPLKPNMLQISRLIPNILFKRLVPSAGRAWAPGGSARPPSDHQFTVLAPRRIEIASSRSLLFVNSCTS